MTPDQAIPFLLFSVVAAATPGPSNVMLIATGGQVGILRGLPCLLGVSTGVGAMLFVVPLGLGSLVFGRPLLLHMLHWGGAAILLWLAWKIATAPGHVETASVGRPVSYLEAAIFQWANPKAWLVSASAAGTFLDTRAGSPVAQSAWLGGLFVAAALPSGFLWLASGAAMQRWLYSRRRMRLFNATMGGILALSIVLILR